MRRLKFQYLENNAKDKYVKTIVNDEAPMVTADTNTDLQAANSVKKEKLKSAKTRLAERHSGIRNVAPLVENGEVHCQSDWHNLTESVDFLKAKGLTAEAVALTQSILDARLAIMRLRGIHPTPPLTIPVAEETLSSQIAGMQMLEDELQSTNEKITRVKDGIKEHTVKMDSLRSEKAKLEKSVSAHKIEVDDGRAAKLCERYVLWPCSRTFDQLELGIHRS
jgi:chromosome segregation ATPase